MNLEASITFLQVKVLVHSGDALKNLGDRSISLQVRLILCTSDEF